jgi:hypothetical protein
MLHRIKKNKTKVCTELGARVGFLFILLFLVLRIQPRAVCLLGKHSIAEPRPQPPKENINQRKVRLPFQAKETAGEKCID